MEIKEIVSRQIKYGEEEIWEFLHRVYVPKIIYGPMENKWENNLREFLKKHLDLLSNCSKDSFLFLFNDKEAILRYIEEELKDESIDKYILNNNWKIEKLEF